MENNKIFFQNTDSLFCLMSSWSVLKIIGPDALDYLQRMTTINVKKLENNIAVPSAMLEATGKFQLFFKLIKKNENEFFIITPYLQDEAYETLEKFHFAENFETQKTNLNYIKFYSNKKIENFNFNDFKFYIDNDLSIETEICFLENENTEKILLLLKNTLNAHEISNQKLHKVYILSGIPSYPYEINKNTNPLELGLDHIVHEHKGCYPGQEVMEKIRSIGNTSKKLIKFSGTINDAIRAVLKSNNEPQEIKIMNHTQEFQCGIVTSIVESPHNKDEFIGLGLVQKTFISMNTPLSVLGTKINYQVLTKSQTQNETVEDDIF
jgi:folate-binding protein YgfZ